MSTPLRVLFVAGAGRSGSTVLDTILGSVPGVCGLGELQHVVRDGWSGHDFCACGLLGTECPFWNRVRGRWEAAGHDCARYLALQDRFESRRSWARLLAARPGHGAFAEWARATTDLFRAVLEETGDRLLVDSSKSPARAYALTKVPEIELALVHLVRDGRGVAWSLAKALQKDARYGVREERAPRSVTRTALFWTAVNMETLWLARRVPPQRRWLLRYEDYVSDPVAALRPLADHVGPGLLDAARAAAEGGDFDHGHTIAGNRLRLSGALRLKPDVEWRERMSAPDLRRFTRIARPLLRRFGYLP